jgi:WD40 repeat protein
MIKMWDTSTGAPKGKMGCASGVYSLDVSMTDSLIASGHRDGSIKIWSIKESKVVQEIKGVHDNIISSVNYHPADGNIIFSSSRD